MRTKLCALTPCLVIISFNLTAAACSAEDGISWYQRAWRSTTNATNSALDAAKPVANAAAAKASELTDQAMESARPYANKAANASTQAWDWTKASAEGAAKQVSHWTTQAYDWWSEDKFTFSRLIEGRYESLSNESSILTKCADTCPPIATVETKAVANDQGLDKARELMASGKIQAGVEQYRRWQANWLSEQAVPPLENIKEALLAPSALFALEYLQARATLKPLSSTEARQILSRTVPQRFREGIEKAFNAEPKLVQLAHVGRVLSAAKENLEKYQQSAPAIYLELPSSAGDYVVLSTSVWGSLHVAAKQKENYEKVREIYKTSTDEILKAYNSEYAELVENKALILKLQDLLQEKDQCDKQLQQILACPALSPEQVADLKKFRESYRAFSDQWVQLVCLYSIDVPLRVRILCVSIGVDRAKGAINDGETDIMRAGLGLQSASALLAFYKDQGTHELYTDLWLRLKRDLSPAEFEELQTRARLAPEWFKSLNVSELERVTGTQ